MGGTAGIAMRSIPQRWPFPGIGALRRKGASAARPGGSLPSPCAANARPASGRDRRPCRNRTGRAAPRRHLPRAQPHATHFLGAAEGLAGNREPDRIDPGLPRSPLARLDRGRTLPRQIVLHGIRIDAGERGAGNPVRRLAGKAPLSIQAGHAGQPAARQEQGTNSVPSRLLIADSPAATARCALLGAAPGNSASVGGKHGRRSLDAQPLAELDVPFDRVIALAA
jgi:hypothetical protein